jgi:hypothetical protein
MSYEKAERPPSGLAADEAAAMLDGGHLVAVAVSSRWLSNNAGILIVARARWIDEDGAPRSCPHGQEIVTEAAHSADAASVQAHGVAALCREMMLAVLGEPPTLVQRQGEDGAFEAPMLLHSPEWRLNASIRHAIDTASATAPVHVAALLQS